jgi:hypothetical protein
MPYKKTTQKKYGANPMKKGKKKAKKKKMGYGK